VRRFSSAPQRSTSASTTACARVPRHCSAAQLVAANLQPAELRGGPCLGVAAALQRAREAAHAHVLALAQRGRLQRVALAVRLPARLRPRPPARRRGFTTGV